MHANSAPAPCTVLSPPVLFTNATLDFRTVLWLCVWPWQLDLTALLCCQRCFCACDTLFHDGCGCLYLACGTLLTAWVAAGWCFYLTPVCCLCVDFCSASVLWVTTLIDSCWLYLTPMQLVAAGVPFLPLALFFQMAAACHGSCGCVFLLSVCFTSVICDTCVSQSVCTDWFLLSLAAGFLVAQCNTARLLVVHLLIFFFNYLHLWLACIVFTCTTWFFLYNLVLYSSASCTIGFSWLFVVVVAAASYGC